MPSASVSTAASVNPGLDASVLSAYRMSASMRTPGASRDAERRVSRRALQGRDDQRRVVVVRAAVEGLDVAEHRGEHVVRGQPAVRGRRLREQIFAELVAGGVASLGDA